MERVRDQIEWLAAYQRKMLNSQLRKHGLNLNGRPGGRGGKQENICILLRKAKRLADCSRKAFKCLTKVPYLMVNFLHKERLVTTIFLQTFPLEPSGHEMNFLPIIRRPYQKINTLVLERLDNSASNSPPPGHGRQSNAHGLPRRGEDVEASN